MGARACVRASIHAAYRDGLECGVRSASSAPASRHDFLRARRAGGRQSGAARVDARLPVGRMAYRAGKRTPPWWRCEVTASETCARRERGQRGAVSRRGEAEIGRPSDLAPCCCFCSPLADFSLWCLAVLPASGPERTRGRAPPHPRPARHLMGHRLHARMVSRRVREHLQRSSVGVAASLGRKSAK